MLAAPGKLLVDFGLRRAHGGEAGLMAARASYIAGFAGTATVSAEQRYGIPTFGTMAHSFIEVHDDESLAFEDFAALAAGQSDACSSTPTTPKRRPAKWSRWRRASRRSGITIRAVRLDSGDLTALSKSVRGILDRGGLADVAIFASGGLDEDSIAAMLRAGAPIDGFGVGTSLTTSSDVPTLDCVYKLQEYAGLARRKRSVGKATWPGRKQVWRRYGADGRMAGDVLSLESDAQAGEPLIQLVMHDGRRIAPPPPLAESRARAARDLERLPEALRGLDGGTSYPVAVAETLERLAGEVDNRLAMQEGSR